VNVGPPSAGGNVDRGRIGTAAHPFGQFLRGDLGLVERHPRRERNPQSITDQYRLDMLASTRSPHEFNFHKHHLYRVGAPPRRAGCECSANGAMRFAPSGISA